MHFHRRQCRDAARSVDFGSEFTSGDRAGRFGVVKTNFVVDRHRAGIERVGSAAVLAAAEHLTKVAVVVIAATIALAELAEAAVHALAELTTAELAIHASGAGLLQVAACADEATGGTSDECLSAEATCACANALKIREGVL